VRKFSRRFRSRRFSRPGRAPGGRKRHWITRFFANLQGQVLPGNQFADLFQLVDPFDYGDAGSGQTELNYGTVVRVVGRVFPDLLVGAPGANSLLWSAAVFTRSQRSVFFEYDGDATTLRGENFFIHPDAIFGTAGSSDTNLQRLKPMAWMPFRAWSGAWRTNEAGAVCTDFFSDINLPNEASPWEFDIKQRRRMQTDDALWLLVSGIYGCETVAEESPVFNTCLARTLLHDD